MRKCVLPLLLCAVLLCGCGGEKSLTVQDQYRTVVSADMEAEVVSRTASDDRTFTLTCRYDRAGQSVTTVTAPEALKGLTAVLVDGQLSLKSRDQLLPAGDATDICPANCLPYDLVVWLKIENASKGGYGFIKLDPTVPEAGSGFGMNVTGSPNWNSFICGYDGANETDCQTAEQAKDLYKG